MIGRHWKPGVVFSDLDLIFVVTTGYHCHHSDYCAAVFMPLAIRLGLL